MTTDRTAIVTCSYEPDSFRCRRLCTSIDRYVPDNIEHCLIVPRRDYHLFHDLCSARRTVHFVEDIVPGDFVHIPIVNKWWLGKRGHLVRGWIMQQMTKLSSDHITDAELLLFADSDLQFIRPFDQNLIRRGELLRLHSVNGAGQHGVHLRWHHRAAKLLGTTPRYFGSDYIGQLVSWRRSNLSSLKTHLEHIHGRPWYELVASCFHFSEYILYGAFCEHFLESERNGHFNCADDICHCCWFPADAEELRSGVAVVNARVQALLLQSNLGLNPRQEAQLLSVAKNQLGTPLSTGV